METTLNVVILSHTPEFEQNIVRGARLCYSSASIEELKEKITPEEATKFLDMILKIGHGSILEHSSITFGIEGVSRSLTHQLVRHRIGCSYSQKSQRYVREGQFEYIVPEEIAKDELIRRRYIDMMTDIQLTYDYIVDGLMMKYFSEYLLETKSDMFEKGLTYNEAFKEFKTTNKKKYSEFEKKAIENARYVLPNACETKIQVTMNVRSLFNFFKERLCDRAQDEIREMAYQMWLLCMEISPTIFQHAVPTCVNGKCKEGSMSCGKMAHYKEKHKVPVKVDKGE